MWVTPVDNSVNKPVQHWATPIPAGVALIGVGAAFAVAAAASYTERPAMILFAIAAAVVIASGAVALLRRPRLSLAAGPVLTVGTLRGRFDLGPDDIESIELLATRRLAFRARQLLVETTEHRLMVFGQWDLGANPAAVAEELVAAGFVVKDRTRGDAAAQEPDLD